MRTDCGGHRHPFARPANAFAEVNYCLAEQVTTNAVILSEAA